MFSATLEDALQADLVLHVRDLSHPNTVNQNLEVLYTFKKLKFLLNDKNSLTVGNKIDKTNIDVIKSAKSEGILPISATMNVGLDYLRADVKEKLMIARDLEREVLKVRTGSDMMQWLTSQVTLVNMKAFQGDLNYSLVTVIWSKEMKGKFYNTFMK